MERKLSPCSYCTRVPDPRDCENKACMLWRRWFIERWEQMRSSVRCRMDTFQPEPVGACVSGTHYAAPNQVERYLRTDPCEACLCPRDLCRTPCRLRRNWDQAREDVFA